MVEMRIKNIIVGSGPFPSAVVLTPLSSDGDDTPDAPAIAASDSAWEAAETDPEQTRNLLPIAVGTVEAACIGTGVDDIERPRPMTHDLLANVIAALGASIESVSITRVEGSTFFATVDLTDATGATHHIDARPSDAIALAVRTEVPILVSEDVLEQGGMPNFTAIKKGEESRELRKFHEFVSNLSPEDFRTSDPH